MRWMMGEPLFLTGDLADAARARQEDHREASVREGLIRDFVERDVPTNWLEWSLDKRRDYWAGACKGQDIPTMPRDRICAAEVWCELFNGAPRDIKQTDTREINAVLASTPRLGGQPGHEVWAVQAAARLSQIQQTDLMCAKNQLTLWAKKLTLLYMPSVRTVRSVS